MKSLFETVIEMTRAATIVTKCNEIPGVEFFDYAEVVEDVLTYLQRGNDVENINDHWWQTQSWHIERANSLGIIIRLGDQYDKIEFSISRLNHDVKLGFAFYADGTEVSSSSRKYYRSDAFGSQRKWVVTEEKGKLALTAPVKAFKGTLSK